MFHKILVAADGSEHSDKAVRMAGDLAIKYGADLTLIHVLGHGEVSDEFVRMAESEHLIAPGKTDDIVPARLYGDV